VARQVVTTVREMGWHESVSISCFDLTTCAVVRSFDATSLSIGSCGTLIGRGDDSRARARVRRHQPALLGRRRQRGRPGARTGIGRERLTVNSLEDLERMASFGVASIITDEPALARRVVR